MRRLITRIDIVLPDRLEHDASLLIEDERILAICPSAPRYDRELDGEGALCLPGLIDLHCDAIEKEIEPRPRVAFDHRFALENSDRRNLAAGITTVYHAVSFATGEWGVRDPEIAAALVRQIRAFSGCVEHRVHVRCEVTDAVGEGTVRRVLEDGLCDLLSFMDHSPGQGQFRDLAAYVAYMTRTYHVSEAEARRAADLKVAAQPEVPAREARLAALARQRGIAMASHDDDSAERVARMASLGVTISEFPINLTAARAACQAGMVTLFGAPNILRGASSSGNIRALDAVHAGVCRGLCADYHPPSLLAAALRLPAIAPLTLPEAVQLVTWQPARAAGLHDRGAIQPQLRADLVLVRGQRVEAVLVAGRKVFDTVDRLACA
ncbi:MAG: alpha-D-ribose 1-methylphosphonate 5-triphosphate diphosphatase [Planctomycetota bacterium]|nr:alpha-D-ribose 1-methylphosphonate 5-triphosphate diphosphatase [Planctomycetota bacterium]MCX8039517.1 alpha-D-ribose 1-methylphosphonate 5-triphosphate diphosphatase [Planctomycetota bacterium]MDW8373037.1 alpha-D-ribose 1-methylphosphonate 5-triphosphate diphosphatase [Planctomycetota bacterium]